MDNLLFVIKDQLKNVSMWRKFVEPFRTKEDRDNFWRGEFFGKQMRGASLAYRVSQDEELYEILTNAAKDLLSTQEDDGRISTYPRENEFSGWDMWSRKYVLTGLLHYYDICKDEVFKKTIIEALKKHLDYIIDHVGREEGKIEITKTSSWWGCVNSCTILEPTLALYKITKEERYMAFARYILSTGGCADCNLIELALKNELSPFQYPVTKAYEMMSFYEGLLAYYEITGERKYFTAASNFIESVASTDLTVIGCSGCTHELFDHSSVEQTEPHENIMQETCVAVTWMRLSARLYFLTGEAKYLRRIEQSGFNDLYGSLNIEHEDQHNLFTKTTVKGMTFDSYSPLYVKERGQGIGGFLTFESGGYCGCCVAIGACGIALMPLMAALEAKEGLILSHPISGEVKAIAKDGSPIELHFNSSYPSNGVMEIEADGREGACIDIYMPSPINSVEIKFDGSPIESDKDGYLLLPIKASKGKRHTLTFKQNLVAERLNGKASFRYGALTLAGDEAKCVIDLEKAIELPKVLAWENLPPEKNEFVRLELNLKNGEKLLLSDYQSCGKKWNGEKNKITVWFNLL